jgi:hypothetical protein
MRHLLNLKRNQWVARRAILTYSKVWRRRLIVPSKISLRLINRTGLTNTNKHRIKE